MSSGQPGVSVRFDPGAYLAVLSQAVARHLGDLRVGLRSIDDGSFDGKAATPRQGALLSFSLEPPPSSNLAATRLCNRSFVTIIGELITYLDRMIAVQRMLSKQLSVPSGMGAQNDLLRFIQQEMEKEYSAVARDGRLTNPKKVSLFRGIADIAEASALSFFAVRRALEHHGGRSSEDLKLRFARLKLLAGDLELTRPGQAAPPGVGISLGMDHVSRLIPRGTEVTVGEDEIEHIVFTIQHLIGPEVRRVIVESGRPAASAAP